MKVIIRASLVISALLFMIFISFYGCSIFNSSNISPTSVSGSSGFPSTINFVSRTSGTTNDLIGVAYGNGMFVAVGYNSTILKSNNGINWAPATNPPSTSKTFVSVAYGNGKFVAVSFSPQEIWYSFNGDTWTQVTSLPVTIAFTDVIYKNSLFLASGSDTTILRSNSGVNWNSISTGSTNWLFGVGYGNGNYVAVGESGTIITSTDLSIWTTQTSGIDNLLWHVGYGNNIFVVCGNDGTILSSDPNSVTQWNSITSETTQHLRRVRYFNNTFFIVGNEGVALGSTDGTNWNSHNTGTTQNLFDIAYNGLRLVVVGDGGTILTYP
jgi:hypothetical protein